MINASRLSWVSSPNAVLLRLYRISLLLIGVSGGLVVQPATVSAAVLSQTTPAEAETEYLRPTDACPDELHPLVDRLLQDLPTYAGLVASRSLGLPDDPSNSSFGSVLLASEPNFNPIDLPEPLLDAAANAGTEVQQVFFTTLERQYWQGRPVSLQNYHWLFLTRNEQDDWYLALIYSSVGQYPATEWKAPSPPQESSAGIIGQAVTLWLRDCRSGAVFPPDTDAEPRDDPEPANGPPSPSSPDSPDSIEF